MLALDLNDPAVIAKINARSTLPTSNKTNHAIKKAVVTSGAPSTAPTEKISAPPASPTICRNITQKENLAPSQAPALVLRRSPPMPISLPRIHHIDTQLDIDSDPLACHLYLVLFQNAINRQQLFRPQCASSLQAVLRRYLLVYTRNWHLNYAQLFGRPPSSKEFHIVEHFKKTEHGKLTAEEWRAGARHILLRKIIVMEMGSAPLCEAVREFGSLLTEHSKTDTAEKAKLRLPPAAPSLLHRALLEAKPKPIEGKIPTTQLLMRYISAYFPNWLEIWDTDERSSMAPRVIPNTTLQCKIEAFVRERPVMDPWVLQCLDD